MHLDIPALAQISWLVEFCVWGAEAVLDCDYRAYGRHRAVWWDDYAPDWNPALAGEQSQFGTALRIYPGHDGCECRMGLAFGLLRNDGVHRICSLVHGFCLKMEICT
jgi:hypothetical protein